MVNRFEIFDFFYFLALKTYTNFIYSQPKTDKHNQYFAVWGTYSTSKRFHIVSQHHKTLSSCVPSHKQSYQTPKRSPYKRENQHKTHCTHRSPCHLSHSLSFRWSKLVNICRCLNCSITCCFVGPKSYFYHRTVSPCRERRRRSKKNRPLLLCACHSLCIRCDCMRVPLNPNPNPKCNRQHMQRPRCMRCVFSFAF